MKLLSKIPHVGEVIHTEKDDGVFTGREPHTSNRNQMKLFNVIAAAAVIGTSFLAANSAEAFWGRKISWDVLLEGQLTSSEQKKIYDERGWTFYKKINAMVWYSKLFDCKGNECIYFTKVIEDEDKSVAPRLLNCHSGYSEALNFLIKGLGGKDPEAQIKYC